MDVVLNISQLASPSNGHFLMVGHGSVVPPRAANRAKLSMESTNLPTGAPQVIALGPQPLTVTAGPSSTGNALSSNSHGVPFDDSFD